MELRFQDPTFHGKEFTLKFLRSGKVVAKIGNCGTHYTLHPGSTTRVLDLHRTDANVVSGHIVRISSSLGFGTNKIKQRLTLLGRKSDAV